jgi:small subunit ribosomal protein S8
MRPSDTVADMLTRIRNACMCKHRFVDIPSSKLKLSIVKILKSEGFVQDFIEKKQDGNQGTVRVFLKYTKDRMPVIHGLERLSRPSCRRYVSHKEIPVVLGGMGIAVVSTSSGIMTGRKAKEQGVGGELLCKVW